jgi:zinc protease
VRQFASYSLAVISLAMGCVCTQAKAGLIVTPDVMDRTLDNGLRVMLVEHHEQPTTSFHVLVKAGKIDDPLGQAGLAGLTALLLREGTTSRSSDKITAQLAQMGAQFSSDTRDRYTTLKIAVLNQYAQPGLALFSDMLLNPSLPGRALKRIRKDAINMLSFEQSYGQFIAAKHLKHILFGPSHPLGRPSTKTSLKKSSTKDLQAFYQKHICPNNAVLLVIGDFVSEHMMGQIQDHFGSWKRGDLGANVPAPSTFTRKGKIRVVHKPDATQAFIHLNHWALPWDHPDFYTYRLMNYVLGGGGFSSHLMQSVRSRGGKTYDIRSSYAPNADYGTITIQTATRNQAFLSTYQLILSVLSDCVEQGINAAELNRAKAYYTGAIPLQWETPDAIARKILLATLNGFSMNDLSQEVMRINRVQLSDVNRVVKTYLNPESFNVGIVGDSKELAEQLKQIGPFEKRHYKARLK